LYGADIDIDTGSLGSRLFLELDILSSGFDIANMNEIGFITRRKLLNVA
jgi:hypothetical protein